MKELTKKQTAVLNEVEKFILTNGFAPTCTELAEIMGYPSPNSITLHLSAIEKKGFIKRKPKTARSIIVLGEVTEK